MQALKRHVNPTSSIWCRNYKLAANTKRKVECINTNKNITVDLKMPENRQIEVDDTIEETLITIYSAKEPAMKKICLRETVHEKEENEQNIETSPVLSGRRELINPFVKKAQTNLLKSFTAVQQSINEKNKVTSNFFHKKYTNSVEEESTVVETDVSNKTCSIKDNETAKGKNNEVVVLVDGQTVVVSKFFSKHSINSCETVTCSNDDRNMENNDSERIPNSHDTISSNYSTNSNCDSVLQEEQSISQDFTNTTNSQEICSQVDMQLLNTGEDSQGDLTQNSKISVNSATSKASKNTLDVKTAILFTNVQRTSRDIQGETKTCRQPGLRKRSSKTIKPIKNQPSILSMFAFTKK